MKDFPDSKAGETQPARGLLFRIRAVGSSGSVEPIIATARLLLSLLMFVAAAGLLGSVESLAVYWISAGYLLAAAVLVFPILRPRPNGFASLGLQFAEVGAFTALMLFSGGPASPFFVCYIFLLLAAALRRDWRAAVGFAGLELLLFGLIAVSEAQRHGLAALDVDRLLLRAGFLVFGGVLVGFLAHQAAGQPGSPEALRSRPGTQAWAGRSLKLSVEQAIALGRAALGTFSVFAIWIDPTQPERHVALVYGLLAAYAVLAWAFAAYSFVHPVTEFWRRGSHAVDVAFFSIILALTGGATSAFFVVLTLLLLIATLRWEWRGAAITGATLALVLLILVIGDADRLRSERPDLDRIILRGAYLVIAGAMLAYFGALRERSREQIGILTGSRALLLGEPAGVQGVLARARELVMCRSVLAVWRTEEEPLLRSGIVKDGGEHFDAKPPEAWGNVVAPELGTSILYVDIAKGRVSDEGGSRFLGRSPVSPALCAEFQIRRALVVPFAGTFVRGHAFFLEPLRSQIGQESWGAISAARLALELDTEVLRERAAETATARERLRLARELHDGVLQGLTAIALQLRTLGSKVPLVSRNDLGSIRKMLSEEQRKLRWIVDSGRAKGGAERSSFTAACQRQAEDLARRWRCSVTVNGPDDLGIPAEIAREIALIFEESVANAVRHGGATAVSMDLEPAEGSLRIRISDNGTGLPTGAGAFDGAELEVRGIGPLSVRQRTAQLGGSLYLYSAEHGLVLDLSLPLP